MFGSTPGPSASSAGGLPVLRGQRRLRLPPEVSRFIYVRNLPYQITADELYDIFGKYGPIRQIRKGVSPETKGTAFVVYDDIYDAKNAVDHLSGFNVAGRYLVVLYYNPVKAQKRKDLEKQREQVDKLRTAYNVPKGASTG
eukprot:GHVT01018527.1.p1 GENE.GHVT01018527.1~~GHVT01018527.1.p1  ORF type:complete len:141 (-),score=29.28 GHVT01018527.1:216-638(-)